VTVLDGSAALLGVGDFDSDGDCDVVGDFNSESMTVGTFENVGNWSGDEFGD
jgi:hypothetical protein